MVGATDTGLEASHCPQYTSTYTEEERDSGRTIIMCDKTRMEVNLEGLWECRNDMHPLDWGETAQEITDKT